MFTGTGNIVNFHRLAEVVAQHRQLGQDIAIQHVHRIDAPGTDFRCIQRQEAVGVPQGQQDLSHTVANSLLSDDQVAAAQNRRCHQEPPHGVGAVAIEHLCYVWIVAQRLAHLLAIETKDNPMRHTGFECRPVKERGRQHMQCVKPATGLPDVLDDEVAGVVSLEPIHLERVVHLGIRHGSRVEPHVEHIGNASHRATASRIVWVGTGELVDVGPVQIGRAYAEVALQLVEAAVDIDARVGRVVGLPYRNRGTPVAIPGDRPIAGALQPLAELAVLDVFGIPRDLLV